MYRILMSIAVAAVLGVVLSGAASANDPGTIVNACFKFQNLPVADPGKSVAYTANFTATGASSFNESGKTSDSADFSTKGVPDLDSHCVSLGYYECSQSSCVLTLDYATSVPTDDTPQTVYSGSIALTWWSDGENHVSGGSATDDSIVLCGSSVVCSGQSYAWTKGNVGGLHVIFQPSGD